MLTIQNWHRRLCAAAILCALASPALAHSRHHPAHIRYHRVHRPAHGHRGGEGRQTATNRYKPLQAGTAEGWGGLTGPLTEAPGPYFEADEARFRHRRIGREEINHRPKKINALVSKTPREEINPGARGPVPLIILEAERFLGEHNPTHFVGPWCGAFAGLVTRLAGYIVPPGHLLAWNWIHAGPRLPVPRPGAYAVRRGHVAIVKAVVGRRVILINGNFNHRVAESIEPIGRFVYVEPRKG